MVKTLHGPGGIRVECDPAAIFPDDPGAGTPVMVYGRGRDDHATYDFAVETGIFSGSDNPVPAAALAWLDSDATRAAINKALGQEWV